jgi:ATP-grasp domain, R2K clade family 2
MWIIQNGVFGEEQELLIQALKRNFVDYEIIEPKAFCSIAGTLERQLNAVPRGTIEFVCGLGWGRVSSPITLDNYKCSVYYPKYKDYLFNEDWFLTTWKNLEVYGRKYFDFLKCDSLFIRPNSGKKIFTGTTFNKGTMTKELGIIKHLPSSQKINDDELVLVSSKKKILAECRVVMYKDIPITYTIYSEDEYEELQKKHERFFNFMAMPFSSLIAKFVKEYPDDFYTMDLCLDELWCPHLLELNSFNSAGLYDCNYDKLVKFIKEVKKDEKRLNRIGFDS